ncbi:hypothetical protein ColTof4_10971 [Colletotrichum tofieldiae]|nr:hypothetical protein ColTof3_07085 [Colletotrichum tofieldiae]GKT78548.1 hypothetical protein ColTof4_10971 [Colletotrichum tofieldiae]
MDVATLVAQMNEALASIHATIEGLSTSAAESDTKLDELEQKRDMTLAELKAAYEKEQEELAAARQKELEEIAEQRRREDEEREARRRREDEELAARKAKEDDEKQGTFDTTTRNVEDEMDDLMDNVEEETAKKIAEGEAKLAELEEKRRELNRLIEEQMKSAVPPIPTRKRARTVRKSGAVPSAEPSPLPPAESLAEAAARDKSVEEEASKPNEEPVAEKESAAEVSAAEVPAAEKALEDDVAAPTENGAEPEEEAEGSAPEPPAEPAERAMTGEDDTPHPSDEAQAKVSAEEEKGLEGDDSQPQPEEPVAEKSVEKGISTEEVQPSEETLPTETAASEIKESVKDETSPEEPAVEAEMARPEDASEPECHSEPAPAKDLKEETASEELANSAAVAIAEDCQEDDLAELEDIPAEAQSAVVSEKKDEAMVPEETPESALAKEPAAEGPSTEGPAAQEETIVAENASVPEESHAVGDSAAAEPPAVEAQEEDAPATEATSAEEAPAADATTVDNPKDTTAEDAHADAAHPVEEAHQVEDAPASEDGTFGEAIEVDASAEEHANAPEPPEYSEEQQEKPTTPDATPAEEQTENLSHESSLAKEDDDTLKAEEDRAAGKGTDQTTEENSVPELSMKAVIDKPASEEAHTVDSAEQVAEEVQAETSEVDEHAEADLSEAHVDSKADSTAVGEAPDAVLQEEAVAFKDASATEAPDEATPAEDTKHEENTITPEATSAEPEESTDAPVEENDSALKETTKESDTTIAEDAAPAQEDPREDDEAAVRNQTSENVPAQGTASASEEIAEETDVLEHEEAQVQAQENTPLQDSAQTDSPKEPEPPTDNAVPVHDGTSQDDIAAPITQAPEDVLVQDEDSASEEPATEEYSPGQEKDQAVHDSQEQEKPFSVEEAMHEETAAAEDALIEEKSTGADDSADDEAPAQVVAPDEKAKETAAESLSEVQAGTESGKEAAVTELADGAGESELAEAEDTLVKRDQNDTEAPLTEDRPEAQSEDVAQRSAVEDGEIPEQKDLSEEAAHDDANDEGSMRAIVSEENQSDVGLAEDQITDAPVMETRQPKDGDQFEDSQDAELSESNNGFKQESSLAGNDLQAQPASHEAQAEISELSPTAREEEAHLSTNTSKDLQDGDSEHKDTPHPPEEQFVGDVLDAAEDNSATGPSNAATNAPGNLTLTEGIEADEEAQSFESEGQADDQNLDGDQDVEEEASAASIKEKQTNNFNDSGFIGRQLEFEKGRMPSSEGHDETHEPQNISNSAESFLEETRTSKEAEQMEEKVAETSTEHSEHNETKRSLTHDPPGEELEETTNDHEEVFGAIAAHEETAKAVGDGEVQAQEAGMSTDEEDVLDMSHINDSHEHDGQGASIIPSQMIDLAQHNSRNAEAEVLDPSGEDGSLDSSFDGTDHSREPEVPVIIEHTDPAAFRAGDAPDAAAKPNEYFHPESVSRNFSADPDATLDSSYMTETPSMAADESYEQEQHHGSFLLSASALGRSDNGYIATGRTNLVKEGDENSSPLQSVSEDSDIDEPLEPSSNPFAGVNAASYEQPLYQSSNIPYNPFALQTVIEEDPPRETYNPFARRTEDDTPGVPYNPFARNTTSAADNFLRSASALGHSQPSSPEQSFARSTSAQGRRDSVGSNNPFARSMTPADQSVLPTASTLGRHDVAHSSNNPFARSTSAQDHYEPDDTDTDDEEALAAAESTYKNLFPVRHSSPIANDDLASAAQSIERRQPTPQVPESMYNNPFAARSSKVGGDVAEPRFHQSFSSPAVGSDFSIANIDGSVNSSDQHFPQESSPISARHSAPITLDSIQERYNSELEDMDSDSEEPESLTTSQQLPAAQHRAIPLMPSIAERSFQGFDDSDGEENWESHDPQAGHIDNMLISSEYRPSPSALPQRVPSSLGLYSQEVEDSSEDDGDIFRTNPAQPVLPNTLSSSQYSATPPLPPPRIHSSQGHYSQQPEGPFEGEQSEWDQAFTPVQPSTLATSQSGIPLPRPQSPLAPSSHSQTQFHVNDSDEENEGVLPSGIAQPNISSTLSTSGNRATPSSPPPPPRAPSSQGLYHQEHQDSSEDEAPYSQNIARPGQFPFSSSSQSRATAPPPPPPRASSSQRRYRQNLEDSDDEEDVWDSKATRPGQIPALSTSQYRATPPPPPPPREPTALDRYRQELEDSDSEENEEAWEANGYGQATNVMGVSNLMGSNQMGVDPTESASPLGINPMMASSLPSSTSPPTTANQMAQTSMTESLSRESALATSSQALQSHQRGEDGEESDDSWENIRQRGEEDAISPADRTVTASTPQLRVDSYEQQWPNMSNDQISTASTYPQPSGPGDFTDTESQEYASPLPSAGFSTSSQYTQGATESPRHPEPTSMAHTYDQSHDRGVASPSYDRGASFRQESSLAEELSRDDVSDSDVSEYNHTQAPAFLTQIGTAQQPHEPSGSVLNQVIDSFHSDEDDGPKTAVISSEEHPTQYASSRFGATSWRDELRSPTLFGATRHSRSGSLREELQKSLHQDAESIHSSPLQSAYQPEAHVQDPYEQQQFQVYGQEVFDQQPQLYEQDPYAQQHPEQPHYGQQHFETQPYGLAEDAREQSQAQSAQPTTPQPRVQVSEVQAEEEENEQITPHLAPQQSEQQSDISPLALRQESPATPSSRGTPSRGLAFSRHNPDRPQTPPTQSSTEEDIDPELIIPRDVTNVPWHARNDSVPHSMRSQSTIDSMASSPVHSALHADKHEPVIRDSWPVSVHNLTRPRNDSTLTDRDDHDPFKYEGGAKPMRGPSGSVGSSSDSPPRIASNNSPGSLISRMRGIFENAQVKQEPASPVRSRPVSGVFHPVRRTKTGGEDDGPGYERKAGFLNEAEDEVDEQSALLRSSAGGLEAN